MSLNNNNQNNNQLPILEPKTYSTLSLNQQSIINSKTLNHNNDLNIFKLDKLAQHKPQSINYLNQSKSSLIASKFFTSPSSSPSFTTSFNNNNNNSNRQPLACIGCRKQKLKCLGGKPCQRCEKRRMYAYIYIYVLNTQQMIQE